MDRFEQREIRSFYDLLYYAVNEYSLVVNEQRCLEDNPSLVRKAWLATSPYIVSSQSYLKTTSHPTDFNYKEGMLETAKMIS